MQLFGSEAPHPMVFEWWEEHCKRCSARIWSVCRDALARDVDVVLDLGFPSLQKFVREGKRHGETVEPLAVFRRELVRNHQRDARLSASAR